MGGWYNKAELKAKGDEVVKEAKLATRREAESYRAALDAQAQQEARSKGVENTEHIRGMQPITKEEEAEFNAYLDESFSWIPSAFEGYGDPNPDDFDGIIKDLAKVEGTFGGSQSSTKNGDLAWTEKAKSEIEEWKGVFAENLYNNLLLPLPTIQDNHGKIAHVLTEAMKGTQNIYNGQKRDISQLADDTIKQLKKCGTRDGDNTKLGLTVAACLMGVAAAALALPSGGTSVYVTGIVMASISSSTIITNATVKPGDGDIGGKTVNDVIKSMSDGMSRISTEVSDQEQKVVKVLSKNYEMLTGLRQLGNSSKKPTPISPMRPTIADSKNPSSGLKPEGPQ